MAEKTNPVLVHQDFNQQKLKNALLDATGQQSVSNATGRADLKTAFRAAVETKYILVYQVDSQELYIWDGGGAAGDFIPAGGGSAAGPLRLAGTITKTTQKTVSSAVKKGDVFLVTGARGEWYNTTTGLTDDDPGLVTPFLIEPGDWIIFIGEPVASSGIASDAELGDEANWTVKQQNIDVATEAALGLAREATQVETNDGVTGAPTPAFVSPEKLSSTLEARRIRDLERAMTGGTTVTVTHDFTTDGFIEQPGDVSVIVVDHATQVPLVVHVAYAENSVGITSNVDQASVDITVKAL